LGELRKQLDGALVHAQREEQHQADLKHAQQEVAVLKTQLVSQDQLVAGKDRELQRAVSAYENLKQRATQEVQALQAELTVSRQAGAQVDERIDDLTAMLANSEREVARLFKDLSEERTLRKEAEIRLEATSKDLRKAKTAVTKLEKAERAAKGEQMTELQKRLDEMTRDYKELQEQLASAVRDKTAYMQALEGQKGKGRPRRPSSAEGS
jgi:chromosome segregation ATPase